MTDPEGGAPVFVVGSARSGTTLTRLLLDAHPRLACGPETGLLADLAPVLGSEWPRYARYGFPRTYWLDSFARLFDDFQTDYARRRGKQRWADKTPRHTKVLPLIDELFPTCQVVHVLRDGRDVVVSHRRRWGYWRGVQSVEQWRTYVEAAQEFGERVGPGRYLEVRYEDLVDDVEREMRRVLAFLGEAWDDRLLHHTEAPHDVADHYGQLTTSRRLELADPSPVYRGRAGAHRGELDPLLRLLLHVRGGRLLRRLGYVDRQRHVIREQRRQVSEDNG